MRTPRHSLWSTCVVTLFLAGVAPGACSTSEVVQGGEGGATSAGEGGMVGGPAGSPGSGHGGSVGTTGKGGSGHGGSTGVAGTTEATGKGGATVSSGQGGATGVAGMGRGGATATTGRGGTTTTGRGGTTGAAGSPGLGGATSPPVDAGIPGSGCMAPAAYANLFVTVSGHTQADSDAKVATAWSKLFTAGASGAIFFNGPGSDESYVQDTYNNDVRTEGMSYGMMIAVQLDHQTEFDRLWQFVKKHMAQGTGQIAWHVSTSGSKLATGGAPDGDEYFATALIFAHDRWGDTSGKFNYGMEAQWVLDMMRTMEFDKNSHIVEFYAGSGNTDGSYVLPAFYQVWACFDTANAAFWNQAVTAGRMFFHNAIDANGVIGDRSSFTGQSQAGPGSDTIRCVANIMMDHYLYDADPWQTDTYATKYGAYETSHANGVAQQSCNALLGFGLPASSGKAFVDKLWSTNPPNRDYWNGVLYMLAMVHVSGNFHIW